MPELERRKSVGASKVVTTRHRNASSHSKLNKLSGPVNRSKSMDFQTAQKPGLNRASRSQIRIAGTQHGAGQTHKRRTGKAVIMIGPEEDNEEEEEEEEIEEVDESEDEHEPKVKESELTPVSEKLDRISLDTKTYAQQSNGSIPINSNNENTNASIKSSKPVASNSQVPPSGPQSPTKVISLESLKPATSFTNSPVLPQISTETVVALGPGTLAPAPKFGEPTKSHFIDGGIDSSSPFRSSSTSILSMTQSNGGVFDSPQSTPQSLNRNHQGIWMHSDSLMQAPLSENQKEESRINDEYSSVRRYTSPISDAIKRVQKHKSRINIPKSRPSEVEYTDLPESKINWDPPKDGIKYRLTNHTEILNKLWNTKYVDPDQPNNEEQIGATMSIQEQAQRAQQQIMLAKQQQLQQQQQLQFQQQQQLQQQQIQQQQFQQQHQQHQQQFQQQQQHQLRLQQQHQDPKVASTNTHGIRRANGNVQASNGTIRLG